MKIRLFTTPAPAVGDKEISQAIALRSWLRFKRGPGSLGELLCCVSGAVKFDPNIIIDGFWYQQSPSTFDRIKIESDSVMLQDLLIAAYLGTGDIADMYIMVNSDIVFLDDSLLETLETLYKYHRQDVCGWSRRYNCPTWFSALGTSHEETLENLKKEPTEVHSYAGYDVFFWTRGAFEQQMKDCPPFVYNAWVTDHYINKWQLENCHVCYEITDCVKPIHLDHKPITTRTPEWVQLRNHNSTLFSTAGKSKFPRPPKLTPDDLIGMRDV